MKKPNEANRLSAINMICIVALMILFFLRADNLVDEFAFLLVSLAAIACVLLQVRLYHKNTSYVETLAYTDPTTNTRNFRKFLIDAQSLLEEDPSGQYAVWTFDTKNFSAINEKFGNEKGDLVLRRMSEILARNAPEKAFHCRVAGDVFAGIQSYEDHHELRAWFDRLMEDMARRQVIHANQMRADYAMGLYCPRDFGERLPLHDMINKASIARRAAKEQPGTCLLFFTSDMYERQRWQSELEAHARQALQNGDITFFLQPKVSAQDQHRILGAEVLARWNHPQYGWLSPDHFIPVFERNGFIVDLDRYLFEQACKWLVDHNHRSGYSLRLAINVSRQGLMREDLISFYTDTKRRFAIEDSVLELEFTESVAFEDYQMFRAVIVSLRESGFICSIDDFGSGYSSLNVIKKLPIDTLKLDAMFFSQEDDKDREQIMVDSFIKMAKALGISTVAEGIETREQVAFLENTGCDMIQGYVFSKPLPPDQFEALLLSTDGLFC